MSDVVSHGWPDRGRPRAVAGPGMAAVMALALGALALTNMRAAVFETPALAVAPARSASPVTLSPPTWIDILKPVQIYSLQARELGHAPLRYTARRLSAGHGREDNLEFGVPSTEQPFLRLSVLRWAFTPADSPIRVELAALDADVGLAGARDEGSDHLATRFGQFDVVAKARPVGAAGPSCDGFRLILDAPELAIAGLACGTTRHPLSRAALACLIDRLDLASVGDDRALIDLFAASELRRDSACRGMRLGPDEVHAPWLDDKPVTPHRKMRRE